MLEFSSILKVLEPKFAESCSEFLLLKIVFPPNNSYWDGGVWFGDGGLLDLRWGTFSPSPLVNIGIGLGTQPASFGKVLLAAQREKSWLVQVSQASLFSR